MSISIRQLPNFAARKKPLQLLHDLTIADILEMKLFFEINCFFNLFKGYCENCYKIFLVFIEVNNNWIAVKFSLSFR
jgi:hypothetical protein